jgi:DNA/RNA-binding domain of Phe-tRNA-synthetase-like protein
VHFQHSSAIWRDFPELVPAAVVAEDITSDVSVVDRVGELRTLTESRLAGGTESDLPEIKAWRRAFSRMGLEPTRYRCASEALLRRFRKEGSLPQIHPLIDLCNAISLAFAIPVGVFDLSKIDGFVEVRHANGDETYQTFSGETETPPAGEVIFADASGHAHARRWTNRQSGYSAVREDTSRVLIVAEALHESAQEDVEELRATIVTEVGAVWPAAASSAVLSSSAPRFEC